MIFDPDAESAPRSELKALQSERLSAVTRYVYERVPFYESLLDEVRVRPEAIRSVEDIARLPITRKESLRDNYPFGLFAVSRDEVKRVHASSGTTGKPTVVGYTKADIELFARVNARCLAMGGAEPSMMLHNAYGYGLFTGGLGLHYGAELLGMNVVPVSGGMTERQVTLIQDFRPDVICCTPSYALTLAQEFESRGISPGDLSLRFGLVGAEPWTESMRAGIDEGLGIRVTNIYGLSEIIGPGVSTECVEARSGSHINEDHFLPEVVDPELGEPLDEGEEGVLLFTTLTKRALPLLRYWTGDITSLNYDKCECGRTLVRMGLIKGRTDDMLIIRGVNVYPTEIEAVLGTIEELSQHYRLVVTREGTLDELTVEAEFAVSVSDPMREELKARVADRIKDSLGVTATVSLLPPDSVPRSEGGKLNRVEDRRALD